MAPALQPDRAAGDAGPHDPSPRSQGRQRRRAERRPGGIRRSAGLDAADAGTRRCAAGPAQAARRRLDARSRLLPVDRAAQAVRPRRARPVAFRRQDRAGDHGQRAPAGAGFPQAHGGGQDILQPAFAAAPGRRLRNRTPGFAARPRAELRLRGSAGQGGRAAGQARRSGHAVAGRGGRQRPADRGRRQAGNGASRHRRRAAQAEARRAAGADELCLAGFRA